jgi:hypothetical protein
MLLQVATWLLVAAVVLVVIRLFVRTAATLGKVLVIAAIVLLVAAVVLGMIGPLTA